MRSPVPNRLAALPLLGGILAFAFALRLVRLDRLSLWRDEVDTLLFATRDLDRVFAAFAQPGENAPLFFLLMRPWTALAGETEYALRFPAAVFGAASVAVAYALGLRLYGQRTGLLAAALVAANPFLVWYGQEARVYSLLVFAAGLVALLLLVAARRQRPGWWLGAALAMLPLAGLHLLSPLFLAGSALFVLVLAPARWRALLAAHVPVLLVLLPAAAWQGPVLLDQLPSLYPEVGTVDALGRLATSFAAGAGQPVLWNGVAALLVLVPLLMVRDRAGAALVVWLVVPVGLLLLINERFPLFLERYLLPVTLPMALIVAAMLVALLRRWRVAAALAALVLASWTLVALEPAATKPEMRRLQQVLPASGRPLVMVVAPWWEATARYYVPHAALVTPPDALARDPAAPGELLPALLLGADHVWLVLVENGAWDPRDQIRAWLRENARLTGGAIHGGVIAEHYELPEGMSGAPPGR